MTLGRGRSAGPVAAIPDVEMPDVEAADVGIRGVAVPAAEVRVVVTPPDEPAAPALRLLAGRVLADEGVRGPAELGLGFVSEAEMAELNREWMGHDGPTDVLAWPLDAGADPLGDSVAGEGSGASEGMPTLLGDVVVCPAVAARQAATAGCDLADELALLVVHGVLHVLGHDHDGPEEEAAMQAREAAHLTRHHDPRWTRRSP